MWTPRWMNTTFNQLFCMVPFDCGWTLANFNTIWNWANQMKLKTDRVSRRKRVKKKICTYVHNRVYSIGMGGCIGAYHVTLGICSLCMSIKNLIFNSSQNNFEPFAWFFSFLSLERSVLLSSLEKKIYLDLDGYLLICFRGCIIT